MECHYPAFLAALAERDRYLPGFCPSCGARRMTESAALLVDEVLPGEPIRQWVLSVPFPLRFLFAAEPAAMGEVLAIVYRALAGHVKKKEGLTLSTGQTGAVTLIQRFGSALNLNIHFHMLCLDGAYTLANGRPRFRRVPPPSHTELDAILKMITARIARHLERRGLPTGTAPPTWSSRRWTSSRGSRPWCRNPASTCRTRTGRSALRLSGCECENVVGRGRFRARLTTAGVR